MAELYDASQKVQDGTALFACNRSVDVNVIGVEGAMRRTVAVASPHGKDCIADIVALPDREVPGFLLRMEDVAAARFLHAKAWLPSARGLVGARSVWQFWLLSEENVLRIVNPAAFAAKSLKAVAVRLAMNEREENRWWRAWSDDDAVLTEKYVVFVSSPVPAETYVRCLQHFFWKLRVDVFSMPPELKQRKNAPSQFAFVTLGGRAQILDRLGHAIIDGAMFEFKVARESCRDGRGR